MFLGQFSEYRIEALCVDRFKLDGGAMFGVIPKPLWERSCPSDEKNRIEMACQSLILRNSNRTILVDAGLGDKWNSKSRTIYAIADPSGADSPLRTALQSLDLKPDDITDVIVTHLHFDHAGGLTELDENEKAVPVFKNATHWVQAEHLDWARSPSEKDRGSFPSENIEPLVEADLFRLTRGEEELFSGIRVLPLYGHTKAMQAVLAHGERPLFFPADLLPMAAHLHLPYIMAYDINPLQTLREKKTLLARAQEEEWLLFLEHEPQAHLGQVERFEGKYRLGRP